jgi:hypothetical protein
MYVNELLPKDAQAVHISGHKLQEVVSTFNGSFNSTVINTWTNVGHSVSITPYYSDSIIEIELKNASLYQNSDDQTSYATFYLNGTNVVTSPSALRSAYAYGLGGAQDQIHNINMYWRQIANSTSQLTFTVYAQSDRNSWGYNWVRTVNTFLIAREIAQ